MITLTLNERESVIDELIGNCEGCFGESDRTMLRNLTDPALAALAVNKKKKKDEDDDDDDDDDDLEDNEEDDMIENVRRGPSPRELVINVPHNNLAEDRSMIPHTLDVIANARRDEMAAAGLGPRGGAKGTGPNRSQADGNIRPGGPSLRPEDDAEDDRKGNPWRGAERYNDDTYSGNPDGMVPPRVVDSVKRLTEVKPIFKDNADFMDEENQRRLSLM